MWTAIAAVAALVIALVALALVVFGMLASNKAVPVVYVNERVTRGSGDATIRVDLEPGKLYVVGDKTAPDTGVSLSVIPDDGTGLPDDDDETFEESFVYDLRIPTADQSKIGDEIMLLFKSQRRQDTAFISATDAPPDTTELNNFYEVDVGDYRDELLKLVRTPREEDTGLCWTFVAGGQNID